VRANKIEIPSATVTLLAENTSKADEVVRLRSTTGIMVGDENVNDFNGWQMYAREDETVTLSPGEKMFGFSGSGSTCHVLVSKKA